MLLCQAINEVGEDTQKIMNYLTQLKTYNGVVSEIEILANGDSRSSLKLATYQNGKVVLWER